MKYLYLILALTLNFSITANDIKLSTGFILHNDVLSQTIDVEFSHSDLDINKAFIQWMADHYDYKLDGGKIIEANNNTLATIGCVIPDLSDQFVDIYLQVNRFGDRYKLRFYASFGFDSYISRERHPFAFRYLYAKFKNFVNEYLIENKSGDLTALP